MKRRVGEQRFNDWSRMVKTKGEKTFLRTREVQRDKMSKLVEKTNYKTVVKNGAMRSSWVVNLSDHELFPSERAVLENGLNFSPSPKALPNVDIIAAV